MKHLASSFAPGLALVVLALAQPWLERRMFLHMLIELPLLVAIGAWAATRARRGGPAWFASIDASGLTGLTFAVCVSAFWMLPIALDAAVLVPMVGVAKVGSLVLAGALATWSLQRARTAVQAFFVLNWVWMTAVAGVVYQQAPERLCNTYLQGEQAWTGMGLVALASVAAVAWMWLAFREPTNSPVEAAFTGS